MSRMADVRRSTTTDTQETSLNCYKYLRDENLLYDEKITNFFIEDDVSLVRDGILCDDRLP
jgi:hypothetical protein